MVIAAGAAVFFCVFQFLQYFYGWDLPKAAVLRHRNARLESEIELMNRQLDKYESIIAGVEQRDDNVYRSIYNLEPVPDSLKFSGISDSLRYAYLDSLGADERLKQLGRRLDNISKRIVVQSIALDEVAECSSDVGELVNCLPTLPPILPKKGSFRLSSHFGYRQDPVYGGGEFHSGQDFATRRGNTVYAAGNGTVELVRFNSVGYGNEIVINHGYGYKSHYAHLGAMFVNKGDNVQRGDAIGRVGMTGKTTGPHLHYEILYDGRKVNPMNYANMDITLEEFKQITAR